ncbi:hypothetical protein CPT03_03250 [Pedobacter ginsengisoli]|uniref:KAP NTPase domain-containing protein n=1 Tax=Pedobacter ginsengisoli TaxID=363852 RepID=A0A2D1U1R2_9SPHI|nr:P-loop NTPase fold protein [Pedobacter ginsengisoli]ATP55547.1 hypothetical protein CPT03_03250 [Pedobacter ginsengisoli]
MNISADAITNNDTLGRENFARQMVNSLITAFTGEQESLVVGIAGSWGSGKSTLLGFIKAHLEAEYKDKPEDLKVVEFNSWGNTAEDDLERNFLKTILNSLQDPTWAKPAEEADKKLKGYLKHLQRVQFLRYIHPIANNLFEGLDDYLNQHEMSSVEEIKSAANELLLKNAGKLYILIDDIDRLTPKEITQLFKVLKVNLNLKNTVFIIAYDKEVVIKALENEYGFNGEKYLEKIIQVDFTMPTVESSQLELLFFKRLDDLLKRLNLSIDMSDLKSIWNLHGLKEFFSSIRDLNRYFNNLIFTLPNIAQNVYLPDFLLLEAIRTFDHKGYTHLYSGFLLTARKGIWESTNFSNFIKGSQFNETTAAMLNVLFDRTYGQDHIPDNRRLKDPKYFERYFSLSLPVTDVDEAHIHQYFAAGSNKKAILNTINKNGKMKSFLSRISNPKLPINLTESSDKYLEPIIHFWNTTTTPIDKDIYKGITSAFYQILNHSEDKFAAARTAVKLLEMDPKHTNQNGTFLLNVAIRDDADRYPTSKMINDQLTLNPEFEANFSSYLESGLDMATLLIKEENGNWISNFHFYAANRYNKSKYQSILSKNITKGWFLNFFVDRNFLGKDEKGNAGFVSPDSVAQFLPGEWLQQAVAAIDGLPDGSFSEQALRNLRFFAANCRLKNTNNTIHVEKTEPTILSGR